MHCIAFGQGATLLPDLISQVNDQNGQVTSSIDTLSTYIALSNGHNITWLQVTVKIVILSNKLSKLGRTSIFSGATCTLGMHALLCMHDVFSC